MNPKHVLRFVVFLFLITGVASLLAQNDSTARPLSSKTPISASDTRFSIALRGKLFGFVVIEDNYFSTATIGTELLFKGRHSLGVDFTYFGWQYERDDSEDKALYETYERRAYLYMDYKYRVWSFRRADVYFNLYGKTGSYHMWHEGVAEGYNFWEKPFLADKTDGVFREAAAGLGVKLYISERVYWDISANGGKQFTKNTLTTYDNSLNVLNKQFNVRDSRGVFYMRVNLGIKLYVKKERVSSIN